MQRLAEIEQTIDEMRSNQAAKLSFNGITLDGTGSTGLLTSASGNVVDGTGLVSTVNFVSLELFNGSAGLSTSSTTLSDVSGGSLGSFTLTRQANVLFFVMGVMHNSSFISSLGANQVELTIFDGFDSSTLTNIATGGQTYTHITFPGGVTTSTEGQADTFATRTSILKLSAGTHACKLQYHVLNGGTGFINAYESGWVVLGS